MDAGLCPAGSVLGAGGPLPASLRLWQDIGHRSREVLASSCGVWPRAIEAAVSVATF